MKILRKSCSSRFFTLFCLFAWLLSACSASPTATATARPSAATAPARTPTAAATAVLPTATAGPTLTPATEAYWPTTGWRVSTPEEQGMDSQKLAEMLAAVEEQNLALHSLLVIRHGYLVSETYFGSYRQETRHQQYSCTKSFVSTLVGIALDKGYIDRTDRRVLEYFSESTFENLDDRKQAMTLDDLLTMRSGLDWAEGDPTYRAMYQSANWVKYVLDLPMSSAPGSRFNYCSGCSHVLSTIVQQTTGMNTRDFAEQYLFEPLGIANARWDVDAEGIPIGGWGLQITPRDMAKLGYLYLHNGEWDGQQIVSAGWVEQATRQYTETDYDMLGYGYQWWTHASLEGYTAMGRYGQTIFVVPGADLVIVTTAGGVGHDVVFQLIEQYVVPSVLKSP